MTFVTVNILGVYVAPISVLMIVALLLLLPLRSAADYYGWLHHVWHPALFVFSAYVFLLSMTILATSWLGVW